MGHGKEASRTTAYGGLAVLSGRYPVEHERRDTSRRVDYSCRIGKEEMMEKIRTKIIPMVTESDVAADIVLDTIDEIIERQNKIVEIIKLMVLSSGGLPVEAIDKAKKLE